MFGFAAPIRKHRRFFPRVRIGLKIQIALLGILGVLLTGTICLVGLGLAARNQLESDQSIDLRLHVLGLSANYLEAYQIATEFLRKQDERLIGKHAGVMESALGHLSEIENRVEKLQDGDPLKQISALRSGLNLYQTRFHNLSSMRRVLGLNENQGLRGKLGSAVHQIESKLAELNQPRLSILMLMMRRHEKDFILRGDEKYGDDFGKRRSEFGDALVAAGLAAGVQSELFSLMKSYNDSFVSFMVTQSSLNDEVDDFATVFQRSRPTLDALVNAADARYQLSEARATELRQSLRWTIVGATLCVGLLAIYFGQRIANSIARMTHAMQRLASGDFGVVLPGLGRRDEVGEMAQAVETFKTKAKQRARDEADAKVRQDLIVAAARKADMGKLADEFEGAVGRIIDTVSAASMELETAASTLTATAERSQQLTNVVAAASEDASANVQSVASATEQMSSSVNEISRQVQDSARIAGEAVEQAQMTNNRVSELSKAASRIGDVVNLINTIAGQTNLLALNATIEAARAGAAGRGFAVVASEVKALAEQTAKATGEISQQVSGIQNATRESVIAIEAIGSTIGRMSEIASTIASAVEEQGAATQAISHNVQRAAQGTLQVSSSIVDVQRGTKETGLASDKVFSAAQSLSGESYRLKAEVATFLNSVRAP
ncbi:methyl-accepting chemotaxis protein [Bradyrhizobium sp. URHD0069]|uniref:methyl-accepting chemotaxis protein n=1 Tax=Bradyrhizobium sp. URHD0069 TaxID=1380355 RepID=UPI0006907C98|nr:methyl-accepting chemotaxis protein [Bradyrhizobium sp. URHD0069]